MYYQLDFLKVKTYALQKTLVKRIKRQVIDKQKIFLKHI